MSSIIYIEPNKRNRLVRRWVEQILEMEEKLKKAKENAELLKDQELMEKIEDEIRSLRSEFDVVFQGASNDEIVRKFDIRYWDADKVDNRLREINEEINRVELNVREKIIEKREIFEHRIKELISKIEKYDFLKYLENEIEKLDELSFNDLIKRVDEIEAEINQKINIHNNLVKTKQNLKNTINAIKKEINQYSFLEEFNVRLTEIEKDLDNITGIDMENLNKVLDKFEKIKSEIKEKESRVLNSIEAIKEYEILKAEVKEIDELISGLNLGNKAKENEKEKIQKAYTKFINKLKVYSQKEAQRIENLDIPIENKLDELKITYQKEKTRYLISSKLNEIKEKFKNDEKFKEEFEEKIEKILKSNDDYEFYELLYEIEKYKAQKEMVKKQITILKEKLQKLGYKFEENIELGKVGYLDTNKKEYKIKYVFHENGEIGFNFVRIGKVENLSLYEKNKTVEMSRKWCNDFDKLNEELKKEGIEINISLREEPTIDDIIFEELEIEEETTTYITVEKTQERYIEE